MDSNGQEPRNGQQRIDDEDEDIPYCQPTRGGVMRPNCVTDAAITPAERGLLSTHSFLTSGSAIDSLLSRITIRGSQNSDLKKIFFAKCFFSSS